MARALELLAAPADDRELGDDPETGQAVYVRKGRFGPYVQLGEDDDAGGKPKRASLFSDMDPGTVGLDEALELLALPRVLGTIEGEEVVAQNGRYGPFVKRGKETRSLATEADLLTITLEEAAEAAGRAQAAPGPGRRPSRRCASSVPIRSSGRPLVVKEGRFGPYVTDGETNASLRRGDEPAELSLDRALELLAERREKEAAGLVGKGRSGSRRSTPGRSKSAAGAGRASATGAKVDGATSGTRTTAKAAKAGGSGSGTKAAAKPARAKTSAAKSAKSPGSAKSAAPRTAAAKPAGSARPATAPTGGSEMVPGSLARRSPKPATTGPR